MAASEALYAAAVALEDAQLTGERFILADAGEYLAEMDEHALDVVSRRYRGYASDADAEIWLSADPADRREVAEMTAAFWHEELTGQSWWFKCDPGTV